MKLLSIQVFVLGRIIGNALSFPDILSAGAYQLTHYDLCKTSTQSNTVDEMEVIGLWIKSLYPSPSPSGRGIMVHPTTATINFGGAALTQSNVDPSIFNSTATAQYVTYRGYFWVAFVFRRVASYTSSSNCILTNVIYDTVATSATQQVASNIALSNLLGVLDHSYTYVNNPNNIQIVSIASTNFLSNGATLNGYTIGTRTVFKLPLTDAHWSDPKLRRGLRFGFSQYATETLNLDLLPISLSPGFSSNGTLISRDQSVYTRRDNGNVYGIPIYPGSVITRTNVNSGPNPAFMSVIHFYDATRFLATSGTQFIITQGFTMKTTTGTICEATGDVVISHDTNGFIVIDLQNVSWKFYLTNGSNPYVATNLASTQMPTAAGVRDYYKVIIHMSLQYTGNGGSEPDNFSGAGWMWVTINDNRNFGSVGTASRKTEAYMKSTFNIVSANYTNKYFDFSTISTSLTYKSCLPSTENYNLTMFSQIIYSGFPDWLDLVSGFTYNTSYRGDFYRQMPTAFMAASMDNMMTFQLSTGVQFCQITFDSSRCVVCDGGLYPDITNYRNLPLEDTCRPKQYCLDNANDGFRYINHYENTDNDGRGMCIACPPNCKSCNDDLNCLQCYYPAFQNAADPRCACNLANCQVCNTTACDVCASSKYLTYDNRTGSRQCASTCKSYFGINTTFSYGTYTASYSSLCVRCYYQNCTDCAANFNICNAYCVAGSTVVDYNFALAPDTSTTVGCMPSTTQVSGYVYDPATDYFTLCASQNCTKCYATNLTDCDKCVTNNVYLVDHQRCTALAACPNGTYPQAGSTLRCWDCIADCTYCVDGSHDCIKCASGMIYHEDSKTCISTSLCSAAQSRVQIPKTKSGVSVTVCVDCMAHCTTCSSKTVCTQCDSTYYFKSNADPSLNACTLCGRGCSVCTSAIDCQTCTAGTDIFHVEANNCISSSSCTAGPGTYISGGMCHNCMLSCQSCTSATSCAQCATGRYFKTNGDPNLNTCELCGRGCAQCTSGSDCQLCTATGDIFHVEVNNCISSTSCTAGPGTYSSGGMCHNCMPNCQACTSATSCSQCTTGRYFKTNGDPNLNACELCGRGCAQCTSGSDCQVCTATGDIFHVEANNCISSTSCVAGSGTYSSGGMCHNCLTNCQTCSSATSCTQCITSRYFKTNVDPNLNTCELCGRGCSVCTSGTNCQQCTAGIDVFQTDQNICISSTLCGAGSGSFISGGMCYKCLSYCADCTNSTTCLQCLTGKYLSKDRANCGDSCPAGENSLPGAYSCNRCAEGCSTCTSNGTYCLSCNSGLYFAEDNNCTSCLQPGYTLAGTVCKACEDINCYLCPSNSKICTECKPTYLLLNSKCRSCPAPMFLDIDSKCQPCYIDYCGQCAGSSRVCSECQGGYYLEGNRCSLAVFRISSSVFDKKTSTIKITFEHRLFADDYQNLIQVKLEDSEGKNPDFNIESVRVVDGKLLIKINSTDSFSGAFAEVIFVSPFRYFSADKSGYSLANDSATAVVTRVTMNYPKKTTSQDVANFVGAPGVSLLTVTMFVLTKNYAIMLVKIYQMMDFMQMYNVEFPQNFQWFISLFKATDPFAFIPDILAPLHSEENCPLMDQKLVDEGIGCHFISNANPSINYVFGWIALMLVFKLITILISKFISTKSDDRKASVSRHEFKILRDSKNSPNIKEGEEAGSTESGSKLPLKARIINWILETNDSLRSMKAIFLLMQILDVDFVLAMAINIKYYPGDNDRSLPNIVNIILSGTVFIGIPILIGFFFARTKSALTDPTGPYSYLLEERTTTNFFTVYHEVLIMCRNFVACMLTIWLYDKPIHQMVSMSLLLGVFGVLEFKYRVLESKLDSIIMGLLTTIYSLSSVVLLITKILENYFQQTGRVNLIGYPLILLFIGIIVVNFGPSFYELYKYIKQKCRRTKKKRQSNAQEVTLEKQKMEDLPSQGHLFDEGTNRSPFKFKMSSKFDTNAKETDDTKLAYTDDKPLARTHLKGLSRNEPSIGGFSDMLLKPAQANSSQVKRYSMAESKSLLNRTSNKSPVSLKKAVQNGGGINISSRPTNVNKNRFKSTSPNEEAPL